MNEWLAFLCIFALSMIFAFPVYMLFSMVHMSVGSMGIIIAMCGLLFGAIIALVYFTLIGSKGSI
jgi:hypothetical protein